MLREPVSTTDAPQAIGPYSQAMRAQGTFLFCSGQIPLGPDGNLELGTIEEQTERVMDNIGGLLKSAGLGFENVVKTTIFLSSMGNFEAVNAVYGARFSSAPPARSTVAVAGLPKGVDVEIEVIAVY